MLPLALQADSPLFLLLRGLGCIAAIQKTNLYCVSASPPRPPVCLETLDPSQMFQFYVGTFPEECVGMTAMVRFWTGCSAVCLSPLAVLCLSSYNAHLLVRNQTLRMQLFSIGETLGELGAEPEEAPWCFSPTITSYLLVHKHCLPLLPVSGNGPLHLSQDRLHVPLLPWLHSSLILYSCPLQMCRLGTSGLSETCQK